MTRLAIRLYLDGQLAEKIEVDGDSTDVGAIGARHAELACISGKPHLVEIEFLDEPNPLERYYRFGDDPRGMVAPVKVNV